MVIFCENLPGVFAHDVQGVVSAFVGKRFNHLFGNKIKTHGNLAYTFWDYLTLFGELVDANKRRTDNFNVIKLRLGCF